VAEGLFSLDTVVRAVVRAELHDELREALAPILAKLEALAVASPPALVDVEVAAERLGLSPATVRRQCAAGELPCRRIGRAWRVDLAGLRPATTDQVADLARKARAR
jgi:excisionase family DNA binding protein